MPRPPRMSKEEKAARKKASHEALLKRIESNLIELYKDSRNLQQSSFSIWLKAYSLSTTTKYTLFHDNDYDSIKSAIINKTTKDLPPATRAYIKRNHLRVAPIAILDPRSTNLRTTTHQSTTSTSRELIRQEYPSAPKESPASVPFKIVVPYGKISKIIEKVHKSTATTNSIQEIHIGAKKAYRLLSEYFVGIPRIVVTEYVNRCAFCQSEKIVTEKNLRRQRFLQVPQERELFERIVIDLFGMKDYDEEKQKYVKRYVLQIVDHKSKYRFAYVIPKKEAEYVVPQLHELFGIIGPPHTIQSDCGKEFVNKRMAELAELWGCDFVNSSPRHPQTNGTVERANRELKRKIKSWKRNNMDKDWAQFISVIVHQLNITEHETIGISPYQYVFQIRPWKERRLMNAIVAQESQDIEESNVPIVSEEYESPESDGEAENAMFDEGNLEGNEDDNFSNFDSINYDSTYATTTITALEAENVDGKNTKNDCETESNTAEKSGSTNLLATSEHSTVAQSEAIDALSTNSSAGMLMSEIRRRANATYQQKTKSMEKAYNKHVNPNSYYITQIVGIVIPSRLQKFYSTALKKGNITGKIYKLSYVRTSNLVKYKVRTATHRIKEDFDAHQLVLLSGGEESYPEETKWSVNPEDFEKLPELPLKQYVEKHDSKRPPLVLASSTLLNTISTAAPTEVYCNTCKSATPINQQYPVQAARN